MKLNFVISALLSGYAASQNVVEVAVGSPDLSTLVDAVVLTELDEALSSTQGITVFAPTDDAFGKLHPASLNLLLTEQWRPHLENLLLQHVLPVEVPSGDITDGLMAAALNGEEVKLNLPMSGGVVVNDSANVIQADVSADNGVIHVVDTVLFPEWVSNNIFDRVVAEPELTTLKTLITGLHLTRALSFHGPYTVFAPTDEAFLEGLISLGEEDGIISAHLASTLLTYHVVHGIYSAADIVDGLELMTAQGEELVFSFKGDVPQVNGGSIVATDVLANNGIVHKIDTLLIPKSIAPVEQTVVDVALNNADTFSTLVDFVVKADLVDALGNTQGITVFAPTNDAFAALASAAPDVVANLQTEEWSAHLEDVLLYHILPVEVPASAVSDGLTATALNREDLSFDVTDGIFVNSVSQVIRPDVDASNGVIHAIDNVLIPSWVSNSIVDRAAGSPALTTLVDLVVAAGLADTLSGPGPFTVFAPTDDAFLEFLDGTDAASLDIDLVASILKYHVVPGIYSVADIENGLSLSTVQEEDLAFSVMGSTTMVNGESVVAADILANNGIVHVIDGVLLPVETTTSVVMQASLSQDTTLAMIGSEQASLSGDTTLAMTGSEQSSSSGYTTSFAAATTATLVGFGVALGIVF